MRSARFTLCAAFLMLGPSLIHAQNVTACGQPLSGNSIYRGVPALSNGSDQWGDNDCGTDIPTPCAIGVDDSTNTCSYGDRYQCVEYVRRFYSLRQDTTQRVDTSGWIGLNAANFINVDSSGNVSSPLNGFTAFANNGTTLPLPDDMIVFSGGGFGHIAIVESVTSSNVNIIEQNWNTQGLYSLTISPSTNTIENRIGGGGTIFTVVGWLRATKNVQTNPVPAISQLSPSSLLAGATAQELTISGTGFISSSGVTFNGTSHPTTFVSTTQLTISLSGSDLETAGSFPVVVVNPVPGGGASSAVYFSVDNPAPSISSLSPNTLMAGAAAQTLTINGAGFVSDSSVTFNGIAHAATFVNASQLSISLSSSDLLNPGSYPVIVTNPTPGGGVSPTMSFLVTSTQGKGQWTWMGGSSTVGTNGGQPGIYGTLGTFAAGNIPGGRDSASGWTDSSGKFWLFGGSPDFNDLWEFNPSTNQWAWMGGSSTAGSPGVYGTLGTPDAGNIPGARYSAATWTDSKGNLWLFGGFGWFNDVWEFYPSTNEWAWMGGSDTINQIGTYGTLGTPSVANIPGSRSWASNWTDSNGYLWLFGGYGYDGYDNLGSLNDLWMFDPSTNEWSWKNGADSAAYYNVEVPGIYGTLGTPAAGNTPGARYAASNSTDSSGRFWLFGGDGDDANGNGGALNDLWMFNPSTNEWTWVSGSSSNSACGVYGTLGTPATGNVPGSRSDATSWTDNNGDFWLFGGNDGCASDTTGGTALLNDLWEFNPSTNLWAWMGGSNTPGSNGGRQGVYGTLGTPAAGNIPGSRMDSTSWKDSNGNLWLFGGFGYDANGAVGELNDLWRYQP